MTVEGDDRTATRALHRRLYQRGATEADVEAYLASTMTSDSEEASVATAPRDGSGRTRISRRSALVVAAALGGAALAVPTWLLPGVTESHATVGSTSTRAVPALPAAPLLDASGERQARAALNQLPRDGVQPLIALIGSSLSTLRSSGVAVLAGQGRGPHDLDLGPFGITAAGRGLQVVVATRLGRYSWVLTGRLPTIRRHVLTSARMHGVAAVSSAAGAVPASATALAIHFDLPRDEPFVYYLVVTG